MRALYEELHGTITFSVRLFLAGRILCIAWLLIIAGLAAVPYLDGVRYWPGEADLGAAFFSMLAGWVIGSIHLSLVLWFWPQQ